MKKNILILCLLFFAFQFSAYAAELELSAIRDPGVFHAEYVHPKKDVRMQLVVSGKETDQAYEIWKLIAGEELKLSYRIHWNTYKTVIVFNKQGSVEVKLGAETKKAGFGTIIHLPPFTPYSMTLAAGTEIVVAYAGQEVKEASKRTIQGNSYRAMYFERNFDALADVRDPNELPLDPNAQAMSEVRDLDWYVGEYYFPTYYPPESKPDKDHIYYSIGLKVAGYETLHHYGIWQMVLNPNVFPEGMRKFDAGLHEHRTGIETWLILEGNMNHGYGGREEMPVSKAGSIIHNVQYDPHQPMNTEPSLMITFNTPADYQATQHDRNVWRNYFPDLGDRFKKKPKEFSNTKRIREDQYPIR